MFGAEVHDEGTTAQEVVHKAVGQGVLVHPVGGASFTDRRKFRNFLRIAQTVWLHQFHYCSLTLVWADNDLGRCQPTELQEAVQSVVAFASDGDVRLRLVDVVGGRYQHLFLMMTHGKMRVGTVWMDWCMLEWNWYGSWHEEASGSGGHETHEKPSSLASGIF